MTASTGYTVVWTCFCSDAADAPEWLTERCPEHDRPQMAVPYRNTMPGGVAVGHCCDIGGPNELRPYAPAANPTHTTEAHDAPEAS